MEKIKIENDTQTYWLGMSDYEINLPMIHKIIRLAYISEPPHGDSYHKLFIDETEFPGYVWGCNFLFPYQQKYMVCSWMEKICERKTAIINLENMKYFILPKYCHEFTVRNNIIELKETETCEIKTLTLKQIEILICI